MNIVGETYYSGPNDRDYSFISGMVYARADMWYSPSVAVDAIYDAYKEPHRKYHTVDHLRKMVKLANAARSEIRDPATFYAAILMHDIVYDVTVPDSANVWQSRLMGDALLRNHWSRKVGDLFDEDIFSYLARTNDQKLFHDIDWAYTAGNFKTYMKTRQLILEEFRTAYSIEEVRQGRAKWAQDTLRAGSIFKSDLFAPLEYQARMNLMTEEYF